MTVTTVDCIHATLAVRELQQALKATAVSVGMGRRLTLHFTPDQLFVETFLPDWSAGVRYTIACEASLEATVDVDRTELRKALTAALKGRRKAELDLLHIGLSVDDTRLVINVDGLEFSIAANGYPQGLRYTPPALPDQTPAQIATQDLLDMVNFGAHAASTDRFTPLFCCAALTLENGTATLRTTDRYRLTRCTRPITGPAAGEQRLIPVEPLRNALAGFTGDVSEIYVSDRERVHLVNGPAMVWSDYMGSYPRIDHLFHMPAPMMQATVNTAEFRAAAAAVVAEQNANPALANNATLITITDAQLTLATNQSPNQHHISADDTNRDSDSDGVWAISGTYLLQALTACTSEHVELRGTTSGKPLLIQASDQTSDQEVVMLQRLPQ